MKLQVLNWDTHFENDRSRQRDRCSFVCVPNKQHGIGLATILQEPDGGAIYGIWNLLIGFLSRQHRPRDGYLTDTGRLDGRYLTVSELSVVWHRPKAEIQRALSFVCSPNVGWARDLDENSPPSNHELTADSPHTHLEGKGREGKEENTPLTPQGGKRVRKESILPAGFIRFWQAYPKTRAIARTKCVQKWERSGCEEIAEIIIAHVEACKRTEQWRKDGGQYVPNAETYLNQQRWETPPDKPAAQGVDTSKLRFGEHAKREQGWREAMDNKPQPLGELVKGVGT